VKNTKKTLLISVAALIVGADVAAAQAPSPAPAAWPTRTVAAVAMPSGTMKVLDGGLSDI